MTHRKGLLSARVKIDGGSWQHVQRVLTEHEMAAILGTGAIRAVELGELLTANLRPHRESYCIEDIMLTRADARGKVRPHREQWDSFRLEHFEAPAQAIDNWSLVEEFVEQC